MGGLLTSVGSFIGLNKFILIGAALAVLAAFGYGYYLATAQAETKLIAAQMEMYNKGVEAQKKFSDGQFAIAEADWMTRMKSLEARKNRVQTILKEVPVLVPQIEACTVSPEAMKKLNEVADD